MQIREQDEYSPRGIGRTLMVRPSDQEEREAPWYTEDYSGMIVAPTPATESKEEHAGNVTSLITSLSKKHFVHAHAPPRAIDSRSYFQTLSQASSEHNLLPSHLVKIWETSHPNAMAVENSGASVIDNTAAP